MRRVYPITGRYKASDHDRPPVIPEEAKALMGRITAPAMKFAVIFWES